MSTETSSARKGRYMGGDITLATTPNGAITNAEVLHNLAALMARQQIGPDGTFALPRES